MRLVMRNNANVAFSFSSDHFNRSDPKDYFINSNCFGDDLASWLMNAIKARGVKVEDDGPDQEDFGWYFNIEMLGFSYSCVALFQEDTERWICVLEYNAGLLGSLLGKRKKPVPEEISQLFDSILRSEPAIFRNVEWLNRGI
jgi:hypothetical protein